MYDVLSARVEDTDALEQCLRACVAVGGVPHDAGLSSTMMDLTPVTWAAERIAEAALAPQAAQAETSPTGDCLHAALWAAAPVHGGCFRLSRAFHPTQLSWGALLQAVQACVPRGSVVKPPLAAWLKAVEAAPTTHVSQPGRAMLQLLAQQTPAQLCAHLRALFVGSRRDAKRWEGPQLAKVVEEVLRG